jgi:DNA-binding MarR family transcriptional regulator
MPIKSPLQDNPAIMKPHHTDSVCNATAIRKAARHMARFYDACLAETGLGTAQFVMLVYLSQHEALSVNQLAEAMVMDRTTVAHAIKPLERDGLVVVKVNPSDRREKLIALTKSGAKRVQEGYPLWLKAQKAFEAKFGAEKALKMRQAMGDVVRTELVDG